jgi:hypothetical protein
MSDDPNRESTASNPPESAGTVELYWNRPGGMPGTGNQTGVGRPGTTRLDAAHLPSPGSGGPHICPEGTPDSANLAGLWIDLGAGD